MTEKSKSFIELGLSSEIIKSLENQGYTAPTQIQQEAIPLILRGSDVLACAPTGTGKTAAFCVPLIEILSSSTSKARMPRALILEPTRELALQVANNLKTYCAHNTLKYALIVGGESSFQQQKSLNRGVDIIIATPGRFLDLYEAGHIMLTQTKLVVLDEADRMMDMGFIPDVRKIIKGLPPLRQTLLFTATLDKDVEKLSQEFLSHPKQIRIAAPSSTAITIEQNLIQVPRVPSRTQQTNQKRDILRLLIEQQDISSAIVFCNRKCDVDNLHKFLVQEGYITGLIHGGLSQSQRTRALDKFKKKQVNFLIASDIAARGLHINDLPCVINFDVPHHAEDYVHRIGRTGRAGQSGKAFTLVTDVDREALQKIQRLIRKDIPFLPLEGVPQQHVFSQEKTGDKPRRPSQRPKRGFFQKKKTGNKEGSTTERKSRPPRGDSKPDSKAPRPWAKKKTRKGFSAPNSQS